MNELPAQGGGSARRVIVVGDIVTDVVTRLTEPPAEYSDASAEITIHGGGAGANVADWLARTGVETHFVGRVGDDAFGRDRLAELRRAGVVAYLAVDPELTTGTIVVLVDVDGQRTMFPDRGANLALRPADLPQRPFTTGAHLHLSGYTLLHDRPREAAFAALDLARDNGMTVSVDPASTNPLAHVGVDRFRKWTAGADLFLPNAHEAELLTGRSDPEEAAKALSEDYAEVVVTLGPDGSLWTDGDTVRHHPAGETVVLDTTGAGDAFAAGFLAAWLNGADPDDALTGGTALATLAVAKVGARP